MAMVSSGMENPTNSKLYLATIHTNGDRVEVLGFWRKTLANRFGEEVHVYLNHSLEEYHRLYINGLEQDAFRFAHNLSFENSWRIRLG